MDNQHQSNSLAYHGNHHHQQPHQHYASNQRHYTQSRDSRIPTIERYAYCCFCIHVKPTTIVIAIWKLIRSLQFAVLLLSTELSSQDQSNGFRYHPDDDDHRSTNVAFCILLRVIIASASGVAIHAVCSGRAALLMPLYSMVLIDFFLGLPAFYNRDIDPTYADGLSDFRNDPIPPHNDRQIHTFFMISTLILISKIYFLCVIWQCFRYLRLKELIAVPMAFPRMYSQMPSHGPTHRILDTMQEPHDLSSSPAPPPYESIGSNQTKPPTYEDAIKSSTIFTIDIQPNRSHDSASTTTRTSDPASQLPDYTSSLQQQQQSSSIDHLV